VFGQALINMIVPHATGDTRTIWSLVARLSILSAGIHP